MPDQTDRGRTSRKPVPAAQGGRLLGLADVLPAAFLSTEDRADAEQKLCRILGERAESIVAAIRSTQDVVVRVGELLIVKIDRVVHVHWLTSAQRTGWTVGRSPHDVLRELWRQTSPKSGGRQRDRSVPG
jgi:hypothetical protein